VDGNHADIVKALRRIGASVCDASSLGHGAPDLLVAFQGTNYLMEIKTARGKQNAAQKAFQGAWRGHYAVVHSVDEAFHILGLR
jgi:hypothetical protein